MSRTTYPCGYESDYNRPTAAEAKFYDEMDALIADQNVEFSEVQRWLWDVFISYCAPDAINDPGLLKGRLPKLVVNSAGTEGPEIQTVPRQFEAMTVKDIADNVAKAHDIK